MRLASSIARRYLFSSKGTHFINIISGMTVLGLSIGSAAVILVLSVFNGFEELIASMINNFNPDMKVMPQSGKYFTEDSVMLRELRELDGIEAISLTLEETAIFEYEQPPNAGIMKGVDENFVRVNPIDSTIIEGTFKLEDDKGIYAVLGAGMARNLSVDVLNVFESLSIYMPVRQYRGGLQQPYQTRYVKPSGVFSIQQDIDNQYVLVPLGIARALVNRPGEVSSIEIKTSPDFDEDKLQAEISDIIGPDLIVRNRYQQDEAFLKLMNLEKWMAFLIATLMILLISFNLIGCLWMIVLDKQKDIAILRAMGSTSSFIRNVFIRLGLYFTLSGLLSGIVLGILLYLAQQHFGIINMSQGFVVDTYPIKLKVTDVLVVALTVLLIGGIASLPAAQRATKLGYAIREN